MPPCENAVMGTRASATTSAAGQGADPAPPAHVLIVGGSTADWDGLGRSAWVERRRSFAERGSQLGVEWLTLRPYAADGSPGLAGRVPPEADAGPVRFVTESVGTCTLIVDPAADGRERFAGAMRALGDGPVNEASVAGVLYEPADVEPDLVLILGPADRLPPSLVWELAYAELVFAEVVWADLRPEYLEDAVAEYAGRRRRFGGLDA